MQMLKRNLQKWFLSFGKVRQPQSVLRCYLYRQCAADLWRENVEWAYYSQCVVWTAFLLLASSQEHWPPWNTLDDWEKVEVPRPFYSLPPAGIHYIGDCEAFPVEAIELNCFASFASEGRSLATSRRRFGQRMSFHTPAFETRRSLRVRGAPHPPPLRERGWKKAAQLE
jgi:hypothetical protein